MNVKIYILYKFMLSKVSKAIVVKNPRNQCSFYIVPRVYVPACAYARKYVFNNKKLCVQRLAIQ